VILSDPGTTSLLRLTVEPAETLVPHTFCGFKGSGEDQRDRRERQHRRLGTRAGRIEVLFGMAQSSSQHGGTQDQQHVPNDGPGYRRFHHIVKPGSVGLKKFFTL